MNSFRSISVLLCVLLSVLTAGGHLTAYSYDIHGRLTASEPVPSDLSGSLVPPDIGTEYNYDRNANITSMSRRGIIDIVGGKKVYGLHDDISMTYSGNRLTRMSITREGADYEGRTGVSAAGTVTGFAYDSNGNMTADPSRGIARIRYDRLDKPVEVTFAGGHRQTVSYDGFGRKIRVDYAQGPVSVIGGDLPADGDYEVTLSRVYAGAHVFCDGRLEYSGFPSGYFDASGSPRYYITDWQGNNVAVVDKAGSVVQKTTYYPYGEPTIESEGQRYLFGGKEREHAGGRNSYDFGARSLTPYARWSPPDPLAEKFYPISPYAYYGGDPINFVDKDGKALNGLAAAGGGILGCLIGASIEVTKQLWNRENINWTKISGAAAGATFGASLFVTIPVVATANVIGRATDRAIRGEETTKTDVVIDATIGASTAGIANYAGKFVKNLTDKLEPAVKGKLGEAVAQIKYGLLGYNDSVKITEVVET